MYYVRNKKKTKCKIVCNNNTNMVANVKGLYVFYDWAFNYVDFYSFSSAVLFSILMQKKNTLPDSFSINIFTFVSNMVNFLCA